MTDLSGLKICIGKGIPPQHRSDDVIFWYPEIMKTPEEIYGFLKEKVQPALECSEGESRGPLQQFLELPTEQDVYVYTLSPQIIGMISGREGSACYEDALVLCSKHPPTPLVAPAPGEEGPQGILLVDWMAHFNLGDLYLRYELKCPQCKENVNLDSRKCLQ